MLLLVLSMVWNVQPASAQLFQIDEDSSLITNVVADPAETQLTSNCTWKITPGNDNYSYTPTPLVPTFTIKTCTSRWI